MRVLGLNCSSFHDPSAALLVDGRAVAAAEQERFARVKHARGIPPVEAARFCLEAAGLAPGDVDVVAHPWSMRAVRDNAWPYLRRNLRRESPRAVYRFLARRRRRRRRELEKLHRTLRGVGIDPARVEIAEVEHHGAHAASATAFSGFDDCAVITIDGSAEMTSGLLGAWRDGELHKHHEVQRPDSLGLFYSAITDYLGFTPDDGEYKVMGMAPYGDPDAVDLSDLVRWNGTDFHVDRSYVYPPKARRWRGRRFSARMVERFGPPRTGDALAEPYVHIAAATQRLLERMAVHLVERHLAEDLRRTRRLCVAGGCALNVVMNRRLLEHDWIDEIFVPPAPNDAGLSLGAAALVALENGERVQPLENAYLGPSFRAEDVVAVLERFRIPYRRLDRPATAAASLLARGEIVAWFQGRTEWGPRALGNRSILGHPGTPGTEREINERIKFRETWRPFCPSVLDSHAADMLGTKHPSPYMTYSFRLPEAWQARVPEVTHVDGTARPQIVTREANPLYHELLREFLARTGLPCVINTSLNRRGEPMVNSPEDAVKMFFGCGLEHLILEDVYVAKNAAAPPPEGCRGA